MKIGINSLFLGIICFGCVVSLIAPVNGVDIPMITKDELQDKLADPKVVLIDLRPNEYWLESMEKIGKATHMDPNTVTAWTGAKFSTYDRGNTYVLYGVSSDDELCKRAALRLMGLNFPKVFILEGGWNEWVEAGYPVKAK